MTTYLSIAESPETVTGPQIRLAVDILSSATNRAMNSLDAASRKSQLEPELQDLVRTRASQLNGCAYCVDMHTGDLRNADVAERKVHAIPVWSETPFFTRRERAALELTEAMTRLSEAPVGDELFARVAAEFGDQDMSDLIWLIAVINAWNRLGATAHPWPLS
jgi:AhpD family alkylhydroperoxidase